MTVLFADLTGSTALGQELDPESLRRLMGRYFEEMSEVLEHYGGTTEKFIGDAIMAVFGVPQVHEDDALRALQAAVAMHEKLAALNEQFELDWGVRLATRIGVNTGEVIAGDPGRGEAFIIGDAVNVAARLEQAADPGEILIGDVTYRMARKAVTAERMAPLDMKGKPKPVPAWKLIDVSRAPGWARRLDSPLVARETECSRLREVFDRAVARRGCELVTVMGPAGVGKSRLVREFLSGLGEEAGVVVGRCLPYGEGITFWPISEIIREAAGINDLDSPDEARPKILELIGPDAALVGARLAALLGLADVTPAVQETFWAVRKLLEELAGRRPLVVVLDDIHWAEQTFLDLIEYLVDGLRGVPVLLLCLTRPELLEVRGDWMTGKEQASLLPLRPLHDDETDALIRNLLGGGELAEEGRARISDAAEGNPLFVEESLQMLVDDGLLERRNGGWVVTGDVSTLTIPPTIQAVLTARLDRLNQDERAVIERASVIGRVFWWGAVADMSPEHERPRIGGHLQALTRKELIRPDTSDLREEDAFRFTHILIGDAAYRGIPKAVRADLHERFARWVEEKSLDRAGEFEEILGYHLEQAYLALAELGPANERVNDLGRRASVPLASAGRRAFARGDMPGAVSLLTRAVSLSTGPEEARLDLLPDLAFALLETGELARMQEVVAQTNAAASASGDRELEAQAVVLGLWVRLFTDPEGWAEEARREATRAITLFQAENDERGLAKAWSLLGLVHLTKCAFGAAEDAWQRAAAHAAAAGDERQRLESLSWIPLTLWGGPTPAEQAVERSEETFARAEGDRKAMSTALFTRGKLEAMRGNFGLARTLIAEARSMLEEIALTVWIAGPLTQMSAWVEMLAGNPSEARRELEWSVDELRKIGELAWLPTVAGILAEAAYREDGLEQAEDALRVGYEAAGSDDAYSQGLLRGVEAKLHARRGDAAEASRLGSEAVAIADGTDFPFLQAFALTSLAEALYRTGRRDEAESTLTRGIAVCEQKGFLVWVEEGRRVLERGGYG